MTSIPGSTTIMAYKKEVLDIKGFPNPKPATTKPTAPKKRKQPVAEELPTTRKNPFAVQ